jgi:hypothetical protein
LLGALAGVGTAAAMHPSTKFKKPEWVKNLQK